MKTKVAHLRIKLFTATGRRFKKKIEKKELTYKLKYTEDENFYIIFYKNKQQGKFNKLNNELGFIGIEIVIRNCGAHCHK